MWEYDISDFSLCLGIVSGSILYFIIVNVV